MARIYGYMGYALGSKYYGYSGTAQREYWTDLRNRVRNTMDPGETHTYLMISDIALYYRDGSHPNYFFVMKAMSGGVPTGPCWFFSACTGENTGTGDCRWYWYTGTDGVDNYFESWDRTEFNIYDDSVFNVYYHPKAGRGIMSFTGTSTGSPGIGTVVGNNPILALSTKLGVIEEVQDGGNTWVVRMTNGERFFAGEDLYTPGALQLTGTTENYSYCFDLGFTDHDNGLLGGTFASPTHADFVQLSYTPFSDLARWKRFMPWPYSEVPEGTIWYHNMSFGWPQWVMVYDSVAPALCIYASWGLNQCFYQACISGEIITPVNPVDPYKSGFVRWGFDPGDYQSPGDINLHRCWGLDSSGVKTTFSRSESGLFFYDNAPRASDLEWPWEPVVLYNTNVFKGYYDTNLIRSIGRNRVDCNRVFQGPNGPFIKYSYYHGFPWVNGEPPFPPFRWDRAYPWWD